jgi:hypothetical protein
VISPSATFGALTTISCVRIVKFRGRPYPASVEGLAMASRTPSAVTVLPRAVPTATPTMPSRGARMPSPRVSEPTMLTR